MYKSKYKTNEDIEKYKAWLVTKVYTQVEGKDFIETFAPVAKMVTVRCLLLVSIAKGWEWHQMDVSNTLLHGELYEEIYMDVPPGYPVTNFALVYWLKKFIHGLCQASRNWYAKLSRALVQYGFIQSNTDHNLFTYSRGITFLTMLVYVDDLIITINNTTTCTSFKSSLTWCLHLKDLETLKYLLV